MLAGIGYETERLPFSCTKWEGVDSFIRLNDELITIQASPFSEPFEGSCNLVFVKNLEELEKDECKGCILAVGGSLVEAPLQPKDYLFYYPDEHKHLIELFETKKPEAIIAATGNHVLCGLSPFPLFEDGNFKIPSAYVSEELFETQKSYETVCLSIQSENTKQDSYQLVAKKRTGKTKGKIIICAHMDTKYHTPGALDNAAGVAVLLKTVEKLADLECNIDIVPFNGEEYYEASGEIEYLNANHEDISLVVNIDSPCHVGSKISVSFYNFDDAAKETAIRFIEPHGAVPGLEWYAGDHAAFAFQGILCMVISSSDLFEGGLENTHTPRDTIDTIDASQIESPVCSIHEFLMHYTHAS